MQALKDNVLQYVKENGPLLPVNIAKFISSQNNNQQMQVSAKLLSTHTIFAGALLSEMIANKLIKVTNAKIGSSPVYYMAGQEPKLVMLRDHLSERPKMAFDALKEHLVLRDKDCEPWLRVALREIKDFAFPLNVVISNEVEIFWKWYLLTDKEAEPHIDTILNGAREEAKQEQLPIERPEEKIMQLEKPAEAVQEIQQPLIVQKEKKKKPQKSAEEKKAASSRFHDEVHAFLKKNRIEVHKEQEIKKGKDYLFFVKLPSPLGTLNYLLYAKDKNKISDADITLAHTEAQHHNLPLIFVSPGEMSKKASRLLDEKCKSMIFKQL